MILLPLISSLLSGCIGFRYLEKDQEILYDQKLKNTTDLNTDELSNQYLQQPNSRLPLIPVSILVPIYQTGLKSYSVEKFEEKKEKAQLKFSNKISKADRTRKKERLRDRLAQKTEKYNKNIKEGNLFMRWGEPLAVFDSVSMEGTIENMETYLQGEGYFNASVKAQKNSLDRLATVTYEIDKKQAFTIDSIQYLIPDNRIRELVLKNTLLEKGQRFQQRVLTNERERINKLLVNSGYYGFSRQYVSFQADSAALGNHRVILQLIIKNPIGEDQHKVYKLDSIIFTSDANSKYRAKRKQKEYNGITYDYIRDIYSTKILDWRIFLHADSLYREDDTFETQKQLSNMDNFKFVNIKYDTIGDDFIAHIYTSPLKRFETSTEFGANFIQDGKFPGPFLNFSLKNRNAFQGLENMELGVNFGIDGLTGVSDQDTYYQTIEYGGRLTFTFPQFLLPLRNRTKRNIGKFNPKTLITARINFANRPEYERNTFSSSIAYTWQKDNNLVFSITPLDINFINTKRIDPEFDALLEELASRGNTYANSFNSAFVSSSIFTATYDHNDYGNKKRPSSFVRLFVETGGNLINIFGDSIFGGDLAYYKYIKTNLDLRRNVPLNRNSSVAMRLNMGAAFPYGNGDDSTLPYEKFFFAGGSSSLRAWQPRRLGPGSYAPIDSTTQNINYDFEQPADILFEGSIEFRQKLLGIFSWAYFLDFGNSWTWYEDATRPGSKFAPTKLVSQIAIGSGLGMRFDFSFLLVRLDIGVKVLDPAQPSGEKFVLDDFSFQNNQTENIRIRNQPVLNIGIGYPF